MSGTAVTIIGTGFSAGATVMLDGLATSVTVLSSGTIVAITPPHAAGTVDLVVTNPNGESATLSRSYTHEGVVTLTASPGPVVAGGQLAVSWVAPSGRSSVAGGDWIALFRVGDQDGDYWFSHLNGASSGTWTLSAPIQPGQYEFRYMVDDTAVARSSPVTVTAGGN